MRIDEKHKQKVEKRGYGYIWTYEKGDYTLDKNIFIDKRMYIRVMCPYCGAEFDVIYYNFINKGQKCGKCCNKYENSFAYYIQQELKEPLNKYWDWEKNTVNPYLIYSSRKSWTKNGEDWRVWIKCTKTNYHGSYKTGCKQFKHGQRCPFCSHKGTGNRKVHVIDSYGTLYPELVKYWSPKNKLSPFEISKGTHDVFLHICEECGDEFFRSIHSMTANKTGCKCLDCYSSKGETCISDYLSNRLNLIKNKDFITQMRFDNLIGINGGQLRYDFYLPKYNLLIEYQGEFHDGSTRCQTEYDIKKQQEHDRRKREYADNHNIKLLEIWYWDFDNIEEILNRELGVQK